MRVSTKGSDLRYCSISENLTRLAQTMKLLGMATVRTYFKNLKTTSFLKVVFGGTEKSCYLGLRSFIVFFFYLCSVRALPVSYTHLRAHET